MFVWRRRLLARSQGSSLGEASRLSGRRDKARALPLVLPLFVAFAACTPLEARKSLSFGTSARGKLWSAAALPARGVGYYQPQRWLERGRRYGTEEMVSLLRSVATRLHRASRRAEKRILLAVADL